MLPLIKVQSIYYNSSVVRGVAAESSLNNIQSTIIDCKRQSDKASSPQFIQEYTAYHLALLVRSRSQIPGYRPAV
jgi:hypothetical protein